MNPMNTKERLETDLKDAMRANNELIKRTLRMALAAIKQSEIDKGPVDEVIVISILQKEVKARQEAIVDAERANRPDLAVTQKEEMALLEAYLPKSLSSEELEALARQAIQEAGAESVAQMGQVMKLLIPRLQGRASGDQASQAVRKLLS